MTVKVYVDWYNQEILTAEEYQKKIREETICMLEEKDTFNDWLSENYTPQAIWHLTEAGRAEVLTQWEEYCRSYAEDEMNHEETHIEI